MPLKVNECSPEVTGLQSRWLLTEALMGGTPMMRAAGEALLPKWPNEQIDGYNARVGTATLFPAFRRTVSVMAGKPFSKPITTSDDMPPQIDEWCDDVDREGVNLHTFAGEMMLEALAHGLCGILVEAPKPIAKTVVTVQDEKEHGIRPYFVRVMHGQILGWKLDRSSGAAKLAQLRIKEVRDEGDGGFGTNRIERVRVLEPGKWAVYERAGAEADEWSIVEEGVSGLPDIPFVPLYGSRLCYMMGVSPLLDLAYLNVEHWQSKSDQQTILHVARVPILFAKGFEDTAQISIGASSAVRASSVDADLKWVEHTGAAIDAGKESLTQLEDQMVQAGAELLVKKPGDRTATESANDAEANKSDLQRIVEGFEDSLDQALQFMADYAKLGTGGSVSLYKDFGAATLSDASAQLILSLEGSGVITKETAIRELQRRGTLSADIEPEDEIQAVADQAPALGAMTAPTMPPAASEGPPQAQAA